VKQTDYSALAEAELWFYHAYHYGWARVYLNDYNRTWPLDPKGQWFNARGVEQAELMFEAELRRPPRVQSFDHLVAAAYRWAHDTGERIPPGLAKNDPRIVQLVLRYQDAQQARADAQERVLAPLRAKIVGDGRLPDGSWQPAAIALMEECVAQIRQNLGLPRKPTDGDPIGSLQRLLGISATEEGDG
jgi:hypothetical protein